MAVGIFGGTDYRKIQDTDPAANNTATKCDFGTDTSTGNIVCDPGTTRSTRASIPSAPAASQGFGWAFDRALVNRDDAANSARFPSGTWEIRAMVSANITQTGTPNTLTVIFYKVDASNNKTEIFRSTSQAFGCPVTDTPVPVVWTTASQAEVICAVNETIALEVWMTAPGKAVTGEVLTFRLTAGPVGNADPPWVKIPTPGLRTLIFQTISAVLRGIGTQQKLKSFASGNFGAGVMKGVATSTRSIVASRSLAARMAGVATVQKRKEFLAANFGSARMAGVPQQSKTKVFDPANFGSTRLAGIPTVQKLKSFAPTNFGSARMAGIASMTKAMVIARILSARMAGVATVQKFLTGYRTFDARMAGVATVTKVLSLFRSFSATMRGIATVQKHKVFTTFGSARMAGVATLDRSIVASRLISARMAGVATLARRITNARTLVAIMKGIPRALAQLDFSNIVAGGVTLVRRIINIFDD